MVQKFYRRRSKLKPEDWTEEIEKWEKYYLNDPYQIQQAKTWYNHEMKEKERKERRLLQKIVWDMKKEEEKKRFLLTPDEEEFCGHYRKGEMNDGIIVCLNCARELGRRYGGSVGYNCKNHVMRGRKKW